MTIDQVKIDRLIEYLNNQRALLDTLFESHAKDIIQAEVNAIEFPLITLGIKVDQKNS